MTVNQGGATKATFGSNTVLTGGTITLRSAANNNDKFVLTADSAKLFDNNTERASFGATTTIGNTSTDHISIDSDSVDIIHDASNKAILTSAGLVISQSGGGVGEFASTTRIGDRGTEHVEITSTSLKLKDGSTDLVSVSGTTVTIGNDADNRVTITPTSMQIGSSTGGITMDSDGNATFKGSITIGASLAASISGSIAGQTGSLDAGITGAQNSADTANATATTLTNASSSMAAAVQLTSTGMNILDGSANALAQFGDTVTIGEDKDNNSRIFIDSDSVDLIVDTGGTDVTEASFGATTTIGGTSGQHISIDSDSFDVKTNSSTTVASFGAVTTIGQTTTEHIKLSSAGLQLKDGGVTRLSMSSAGIEMGDNFSVDASGNVSMTGTVTAAAGSIAGFDIIPTSLRKRTLDETNPDSHLTASVELSPGTGSHQSLLFRMRAERDNGNATIYELVNTKPSNDSIMIENFGRVQGNFKQLGNFHAGSDTKDLSGDIVASSVASGSFMQRIYFPQGADAALPGKVEQRMVSQESGSRSRIIQSVESLGLGQTHAKLFFDGHSGAVSASNQMFTSTGNLAQTSPSPQRNGKGIVIDSFGAIGTPGEAIPGFFVGSEDSYFRYFGRDGADALQISSSNFILDAGELLTPKLEIKGNITAEGGVIGGFEIEQGNGVNPYDASSVSNLVARTSTFNTASIVASNSPYFEFQSGVDGTGHTTYSHVANTGKTIQKMIFSNTALNQLTTSTGNVRGFFNESGQNDEFDMAYIKTRATAAVNGILTEYTNNKIGDTDQGQRILLYTASGSSGNSSGIRTNSGGSQTEGAGLIFQYLASGHYQTSIVLGNIGTDLDAGHADLNFDGYLNTAKPSTTHGLLLTDQSRLVLSDSSVIFAANGSGTTPSICFTSTDDGFYHDTNGINLMVNNAHDFLFKNGGEFHADADVLAFSTTTSDERLKDDVKTIEFALDKINNLRGVEYVWNKGGRKGQKDLGVIAQEVEKVIPEIVRDKEMPLMDDSGKTYKTVDYEKLTAVLIEGMKEQQKQINELKEEIKELKDGSS